MKTTAIIPVVVGFEVDYCYYRVSTQRSLFFQPRGSQITDSFQTALHPQIVVLTCIYSRPPRLPLVSICGPFIPLDGSSGFHVCRDCSDTYPSFNILRNQLHIKLTG